IALMKIAVAQMTSTDNVSVNISSVENLYREAVRSGVELVVFPENSLYLRLVPGSPMRGVSEAELSHLEKLANEGGRHLMLTTPTAGARGKFTNSTWLFSPGLSPRIVYSKIHLFDVDVEALRVSVNPS